MSKGRPFEPGNKMGCGRPPGSRNRRSLLGQQILEENGDAIVRKAMLSALKGDSALLRAFLPYVLQRPKELPIETGPMRMTTLEELATTFDTILDKIAKGELTLEQSRRIISLLEARCRLIDIEELDARLKRVEEQFPDNDARNDGGFAKYLSR